MPMVEHHHAGRDSSIIVQFTGIPLPVKSSHKSLRSWPRAWSSSALPSVSEGLALRLFQLPNRSYLLRPSYSSHLVNPFLVFFFSFLQVETLSSKRSGNRQWSSEKLRVSKLLGHLL